MRHILPLLIVSILLSGCSRSNDYAAAIPRDAAAVVAIEASTLPDEWGLATDAPIFIFAMPQSAMTGIVAHLNGSFLLKQFLRLEYHDRLKEDETCIWMKLNDNTLLAFNESTLIVLKNNSGSAETIEGTVQMMLRQQPDNSFMSTEIYGRLTAEADCDMRGWFCLNVLPLDFVMENLQGDNIPWEKARYFMKGHLTHGELKADFTLLNENDEASDFFTLVRNSLEPMKGNLLDLFPGNTQRWFASRVRSKGFYELLHRSQLFRATEQLIGIDIKQIVDSFQGDVANGTLSFANDRSMRYAEVSNADFLQMFEDLRPLLALTGGTMQLTDEGPQQYRFYSDGAYRWFGVKDGLFYDTNDRVQSTNVNRRYGVSLQNKPWAADVKGARFLIAYNSIAIDDEFTRFPNYLKTKYKDAGTRETIHALIKETSSISFSTTDCTDGHLRILLRDQKKQPLQLLYEMVMKK